MFIHNGIFTYEGWGGAYRLASGECYLWLFDLRRAAPGPKDMIFMHPYVGVVKEIDPDNPVSLRSMTSHIATQVTRRFEVDHRRLLWVEFIPARTYGHPPRTVAERLEAVELNWVDGKALTPKWRPLKEPLKTLIRQIIAT